MRSPYLITRTQISAELFNVMNRNTMKLVLTCDLCIITFHFDCLNGSLKVIWTALRGLKEIFTIKLVSKKGGAKSTHTMFYIYYWPFCRYNFIIDEIKEKTENNGEEGRGNGISKCRESDLNFCRLHEHQSSANSVRTTKLLNISIL